MKYLLSKAFRILNIRYRHCDIGNHDITRFYHTVNIDRKHHDDKVKLTFSDKSPNWLCPGGIFSAEHLGNYI